MGNFLLSLLLVFGGLGTPKYVAALGDSVMRGDMLLSCPGPNAPCPGNFFDIATRDRGVVGNMYDFGLDGRDAGELSPRAGVIGEEMPRYCGQHVAFEYTVIHTTANDVRRWAAGYMGNVTLAQAFNTYYVHMVNMVRSCQPATKLLLVGVDDIAYRCDRSLQPSTALFQSRLNEFNGYIRTLAHATAGAAYVDTWGIHSESNGLGVPVNVPGKPWYYGPDWYGVVGGVNTGGNCVHPGSIGHQYLGRTLLAALWPV